MTAQETQANKILPKTISVKSNSGQTTQGEIATIELSFNSRLTKAVIYAFLTVILSACSIVVPLLHLFLPPVILICGFYIVFTKFKQSKVIINGHAECPACKAEVKFFKRVYKNQFKDFCEACKRDLNVTVKD